ncbi:MAG TPA: hypothetical protein VGN76_01675 [Gemmatimonadales bacterium]|nr:hypothetical protein [Gemmatimonadales bacterium]
MSITTFTLIHTLISLVAIVTGLVVLGGLMAGARLDGWTGLFLVTTALTSVTGFGFPFTKLLPSQYIGIISLIVLVPVLLARYRKHLEAAWRGVYVVGSVLVLYLNVFVLVDQLFKRIPALIVLAPTHKEPPYLLTQLIVMALFVPLGFAAFRRFRPQVVVSARKAGMPAAAVPHR